MFFHGKKSRISVTWITRDIWETDKNSAGQWKRTAWNWDEFDPNLGRNTNVPASRVIRNWSHRKVTFSLIVQCTTAPLLFATLSWTIAVSLSFHLTQSDHHSAGTWSFPSDMLLQSNDRKLPHVGPLVAKVALGQVILRVLPLPLSVSFHQCRILIFIHLPSTPCNPSDWQSR